MANTVFRRRRLVILSVREGCDHHSGYRDLKLGRRVRRRLTFAAIRAAGRIAVELELASKWGELRKSADTSAVMQPIAHALTKDQIADVAAYLNGLK